MKIWIITFMLSITAQAFGQFEELVPLENGEISIDQETEAATYELFGSRNSKCYQKKASCPLFIIMDSQNEWGYNQLLNSLDYMISLGNIPRSAVLGIGFTPSNRRPYTTQSSKGGKMQAFHSKLFEMTDKGFEDLQSSFSPIILVGHSRTAYSSIINLSENPSRINAVFASSPWELEEKEAAVFESFAKSLDQKKYLFTNSGSAELQDNEPSYLKLKKFIEEKCQNEQLNTQFAVHNCDHILSRNVDFIKHTADLFYPYQKSLAVCLDLYANGMFDQKDINGTLNTFSEQAGYTLQLDDVFLFSGYSTLINDYGTDGDKENLMRSFLSMCEYYTSLVSDPFIYSLIAEGYQEIGETKKAEQFAEKCLENICHYEWIDEEEEEDFVKQIKSEFPALNGKK